MRSAAKTNKYIFHHTYKLCSLTKGGRWHSVISGYLFLLPAFATFTIFMLIPIINGLFISLQKFNGKSFIWVGLTNYVKIFADDMFLNAIKVTVTYAVETVLFGLLASLLTSFLIEPLPERLHKFFRGTFYLPGVAPGVVMAVVWNWLYDSNFGLINYLAGMAGIPKIFWLSDPKIALFALILMQLIIGQGPSILIILAALGSISKEICESAKIDGANKWIEIVHIKIPMIKPTLLYIVVVQTIAAFQAFIPMYLMTSGGPNGATTSMGYLIYSTAFTRFDFGVASAQAVVLMVIIAIIAVIQFKLLSKDVEG